MGSSSRNASSKLARLPKAPRREDVPGEHIERLMRLAVMLLRDRSIEYAAYARLFDRSARQFSRDLKHLRVIGEGVGFMISGQRGGRVVLEEVPGKLARVGGEVRNGLAALRRIADALGTPVRHEVARAFGDMTADRDSGFLHLRTPRPEDGSRIGDVFEYFRDAANDSARVAFRYVDNQGRETSRRAEPYHVVLRNGRYYLVAYDVAPSKGWRFFALDSIAGPYRRDGTFSPRQVPARYHEERAVGWIEGAGPMDVTVRVRPPAAAAVTASRWQEGQRVSRLSGGIAEITLSFRDVGEAVRWALGLGPEATIVAPPGAVAAGRAAAARIVASYERAAEAGRAAADGAEESAPASAEAR